MPSIRLSPVSELQALRFHFPLQCTLHVTTGEQGSSEAFKYCISECRSRTDRQVGTLILIILRPGFAPTEFAGKSERSGTPRSIPETSLDENITARN